MNIKVNLVPELGQAIIDGVNEARGDLPMAERKWPWDILSVEFRSDLTTIEVTMENDTETIPAAPVLSYLFTALLKQGDES